MISVFDFSHQYDYLRGQAEYFSDCSFIHGTNAYCSDEAADVLRSEVKKATSSALSIDVVKMKTQAEALKPLPLGIHFIDSGNYHYMSLFFLERIDADFSLLLIDNHTDMNENAFGDILSCGNWVRKALLTLPHLKNVFMLGVNKQYFREMKESLILDEDKLKKIRYLNVYDEKLYEELRNTLLYISLDKDALSEEYAVTDWDQGEMTLDDLEQIFSRLNKKNIIGLDICGDTKEGNILNQETNLKILSFL